jgi:hypothetical protein
MDVDGRRPPAPARVNCEHHRSPPPLPRTRTRARAQVDAHFLGSLYTVAALDGQTKHHLEETIRSVASDAAHFCVMCVGHNKGWEEVSCWRGGRASARRRPSTRATAPQHRMCAPHRCGRSCACCPPPAVWRQHPVARAYHLATARRLS